MLIRAACSLGAQRWQVPTKVTVVAALPTIGGLGRPMLRSAGIGFLVLQGTVLMLVSPLMVGLVVLSLLSNASTWLLQTVERRVVRGQSLGGQASPLPPTSPPSMTSRTNQARQGANRLSLLAREKCGSW